MTTEQAEDIDLRIGTDSATRRHRAAAGRLSAVSRGVT